MPLHLYANIHASGSIPSGWMAARGRAVKYPVRNLAVLQELRRLRVGRWQKVIKEGNLGEAHYFEHQSAAVAGVKFLPERELP